MSPSSTLGVSKCKSTKLIPAVLTSSSTSSSQNVRSVPGDFEYPSVTDDLALLRSEDENDEDDPDIDAAAALNKAHPRLVKRNYPVLDNHLSKDEKDYSLSVSASQYISKSSTDPKGTTGANIQHTISNRTNAPHHNINTNRIWLSNGISRPKYDSKQESSMRKKPEPQLLFNEQAEQLDACIEECTRRVDAMIAEGIDALAAPTSYQEELVLELTSGEKPDTDGLYAPAAPCRGWTLTQSNLIRDIESLLE